MIEFCGGGGGNGVVMVVNNDMMVMFVNNHHPSSGFHAADWRPPCHRLSKVVSGAVSPSHRFSLDVQVRPHPSPLPSLALLHNHRF